MGTPLTDVRGSLARAVLVGLLALLIGGSLLPLRAKQALSTQGPLHRPLHIVLFAATAIAGRFAFRRRLAATSVLLLALAFSLELAEHFLYHNVFEWADIRDDSVGVVVGMVGASLLGRAGEISA